MKVVGLTISPKIILSKNVPEFINFAKAVVDKYSEDNLYRDDVLPKVKSELASFGTLDIKVVTQDGELIEEEPFLAEPVVLLFDLIEDYSVYRH